MLLDIILLQAAVVFIAITWVWVIAMKIKNAGLVDCFWALGLLGLAGLTFYLTDGFWLRKVLICGMLGLASFRLAVYLIRRFAHEHPIEDPRYAALRVAFPQHPLLAFLGAYYLQAILLVLLLFPITLVSLNPLPALSIFEIGAVFIWLLAVWGESVADNQLAAFKLNPENKGKTCQQGLWRFSRHPNYFYQWLQWFAYWLFALATPYGVYTLYAPALMFFFLTQVTGIAATEAHALTSRLDYADYQRRTSAFFPWFPKSA